MTIKQGAIIGGALLVFTLHTTTAQRVAPGGVKREPVTPPAFGTFHSLTLNQPPFPFNPFPDLPVTQIKPGVYVYDDRSVDYVALRAEIAVKQAEDNAMMSAMKAMQAEDEESMGGGMALMSGAGLLLNIARTGDDGRRIYFDTAPGIIYTIEQSTNLTSWSVLHTVVADDTNEAFYAFGTDSRYYRVIQGSDLIQFPNFHPTVEQSCYIDVYTPVQGTARVEIYANGVTPWVIVEGGIPASGHFRVSDGLYNPNNWPYDGYYNAPNSTVSNWEFRVTVTPAGLTVASANQGIVYKQGRIRNPQHKGITVQQYGALGQAAPAVEVDLDNFMQLYFLANLQASSQVDLTGALLNEFTETAPKLFDATSRAQLRLLMFGSNNIAKAIDRLHYFGHGTNTSFFGIRISEFRTNTFCTEPFTFVALDGCRTAQTTDLLGEMTCFWKATTRADLLDRGLTPGFGCGWNQTKNVGWYPTQGALVLNHYNFWVDFYGFTGGLTHRDLNGNGYLDKTYQDAADFARDPAGGGVNTSVQHNDESGGFVMVGCLDCFFDL